MNLFSYVNSTVMQKVNLNTITCVKGKYVIYLDRDNKFFFSNKRKAQDFLTQFSKKLDMALLFIIEHLDTLTEFSNFYNLADSDYKFKFEVKISIDYINNRIEWINEHTASENRQEFVIQAIHGCCAELLQAFTLIHDKAATRNDTIQKKRCALRVEIIEMYAANLYTIKTVDTNQLKLKAV